MGSISKNIINYILNFRKGDYLLGLQGVISIMGAYFVALYFLGTHEEALMAASVSVFMFMEHKRFGFRRRIAQSLAIVGFQIILLVIVSVFFSQHIFLAIPFHFILFFSLNYYNYFDSPNAVTLVSIQFFYLLSLTAPIEYEFLPYRILSIIIGIAVAGFGLLVLWPTKTHKIIEGKLSSYLRITRQILECETEEYIQKSDVIKVDREKLFAEIMDLLYGLKYGDVFSTTKGKFLFKIAVNIQILNSSLHGLIKSGDYELSHSVDSKYPGLTDEWRLGFIELIKLFEKAVKEDKHALLELEDKFRAFIEMTNKIIGWSEENDVDKLRVRLSEIKYQVITLIDFAKRLILFNHESEYKSEDKLDFLFRFDNFRNNIVKSLSFSQPSVRFAFHMSLLLTLSLVLIGYFDVFEGFWVPMTILLILKPNHGGTQTLAVKRIAGTVLGLILSLGIIVYAPQEVIAPIVILAVFISISVIKTEYSFAVIFITMSAVLLMAIDFDATDVFLSRLITTSSAGAVVLLSNYFLLPNWSKFEIKNKMVAVLKNDLNALNMIIDKANRKPVSKNDIRLSMLNSYQGRKQIKELYTVMRSEPKSKQLNSSMGTQFLVAHERFSLNYSRFIYAVLTKKAGVKLPFNFVKEAFNQAIENIIGHIEGDSNISDDARESIYKLHAFLIDFEMNDSLNRENQSYISDLRRTTKRLIELRNLAEKKDLVFIQN